MAGFERREFYKLWQDTGFDPAEKDACLAMAGYSESTIKGSYGKKIARSVEQMVANTMERRGLTLTKVVDTHKAALDANDAKYDAPDHRTRLKAVDMYYNLRGAYPAAKVDVNTHQEVSVEITMETLQAAEIATGEHIIDVLPEDILEVQGDSPAALLNEHGRAKDGSPQP